MAEFMEEIDEQPTWDALVEGPPDYSAPPPAKP
jgi:hypothetical protein